MSDIAEIERIWNIVSRCVRASINVCPASPDVKMPDGTCGISETVLFRRINSQGRANVKIGCHRSGSGLLLAGESDPTYVLLNARGASASLKLVNKDGSQQEIKP